uniref:Vitamin K epoxide reductase domain-containing protein n=2 Tax=Desulfobacterium TaxID=2295 RepID=E1YBG1_9BACT|nr:hypothetical protein N47_G32290 [uncultured Desulfobacterium sp.]
MLFFSVAGFIYCLINFLWPDSLLCSSQGCKIYAKFTFLRLSYYHYGAGYFIFLSSFYLYGYRKNSFKFFDRLLVFGIVINCGLLIWQALFMPCPSCITVAALLGFIFFIHFHNKQMPLKPVWTFCFLLALFSIFKTGILNPKPIYGSSDAPVKLFISPGCSACLEMLGDIQQNTYLLSKTAIFPVAKNNSDVIKLLKFRKMIENGTELKDAVDRLNDFSGSDDSLFIRTISWINKAYLVRNGYSQVPVLMTTISNVLGEEKTDTWDIFKKSPSKGCGFEEKECE